MVLASVITLMTAVESFAQSASSAHPVQVPQGAKQKFQGVVSIRSGDSFKVRDPGGAETSVLLTSNTDVTSHARNPAGVRPKKREIRPDYFIVTDDRIVLLNEEDNDVAAKKISALDKPPEFEPNDTYAITSGSFEHQEGEWKTTIKLKGDLCTYEASHPSGHFKKIAWKKGVGLVEYASGYGAHADGYRLRREVTSQKQ